MMPLDPEQHMIITAPATTWTRQYEQALDQIKAANGGQDPANLDACEAIDSEAFGKIIEALVALAPVTGLMPDEDLRRRAGLVPVDQAIL